MLCVGSDNDKVCGAGCVDCQGTDCQVLHGSVGLGDARVIDPYVDIVQVVVPAVSPSQFVERFNHAIVLVIIRVRMIECSPLMREEYNLLSL